MAIDLMSIATHGEAGAIAAIANELSEAVLEDPDFMNQRDAIGKSALDIAVMLGKIQIVQELIANGADIKKTSSNGWLSSPCASLGRTEIMKIVSFSANF